MARTKRVSQLSAGAKQKPSSPEYVPDDDEEVGNAMPPSTQVPVTPTPSSSKRRVREDANPTPPPAKKTRASVLAKASSSAPVYSDDEYEEDGSSTASMASNDAEDGNVEDDMETPKASKMTGKKASNLKTELNGQLGLKVAETPDQPGQPGPSASASESRIVILPSSAFSLENKAQWADSFVDGAKTFLIVKARSANDALLSLEDILDPYMVKHGHYENLPNANDLQLPIMGNRSSEYGAHPGVVPGLTIATWQCFGIDKAYVASLHRPGRQTHFVNASTIDVTELAFKEAWSNNGPGSAYIACEKEKGRPVTFMMVGGIMESFLVHGKNVGFDGKAPWARGVIIVGHRVEHERFSCTFATLWQGEDIVVPIQNRLITIQTRNRPNASSFPNTPATPDGSKRVGKMEVKTYRSRDYSPSKAAFSSNKTYIDWNEKVPVYDGRNKAFDPNDVAGSLRRLPEYLTDDGEVPEGTGAIVGYTAGTSKFLSVWKLTFNIVWIVVIAD